MLPSLAKQVTSVARGTRQWQHRKQPQCHARSAALRYHRSAISLPHPPQPSPASLLVPPSSVPIWRPLIAPSPGGGVLLPQPTSFSILSRYLANSTFCNQWHDRYMNEEDVDEFSRINSKSVESDEAYKRNRSRFHGSIPIYFVLPCSQSYWPSQASRRISKIESGT